MAAVQENLRPGRVEKTLGALKAERAVKRITFDRTEANPEETLYVSVPKLNENEVIVPGSLALRFNIDLTKGQPNNFLFDNVSRALVDKLVVKYEGTVLQDTVGYDIYKIFEDFFLSQEERDDRVPEGIQSVDLKKIRSDAGDKKTSGVEAEKNCMEYEMIRSKEIADEAFSAYSGGKEFAYDHIQRDKVATFAKGSDTRLNLRVNTQRRSLKGILLPFVEQYVKGQRRSEKYVNPDITKVSVTVNGSPNMLCNNGIEGMDLWEEVKRFFMKEKNKTQHMTLQKFYTEDKFGLLIDLRSMADHSMHGSSTRLVNTKDGVQLELERTASGSGKSKEAIGVQLTYDQVKRLTNKEVEKYFKRYEAYVGAKTTENLIDSALTFLTKAASLFVPMKNIEALQKELKNDYISTASFPILSAVCLSITASFLLLLLLL
ncbi:hypothetical protein ACROYT_G003046 [Oculina patagonica]